MKTNIFFVVFLIALTGIFDTINQLLLKTSINAIETDINSLKKVASFIMKLLSNTRVWLGFFFCCLSLVVWLLALSKADLNFAFSADSMHYIFIAIASRFILKEKVGFWRWIGTISIVIGIILITYSNSG